MAKIITTALPLSLSCLKACTIVLVFLLIVNYVSANSTCTDTQLVIHHGDGTIQYEDCPRCPPGQGLSPKCGDHIDPEARLICKDRMPGKSYFDKEHFLQCKERDSCMEDQEVVHPCDERTNAQCGKSCVDPNRNYAQMKTSRSDEGDAATGEQSGEQFGEHQIVKNDEAASKEPERKAGFSMISPDPRKRAQLEQVAKREMDEADARSEARRSCPIYERPRSVGGRASYATSIHEKQKAVRTAPHTDLQIQRMESLEAARREQEKMIPEEQQRAMFVGVQIPEEKQGDIMCGSSGEIPEEKQGDIMCGSSGEDILLRGEGYWQRVGKARSQIPEEQQRAMFVGVQIPEEKQGDKMWGGIVRKSKIFHALWKVPTNSKAILLGGEGYRQRKEKARSQQILEEKQRERRAAEQIARSQAERNEFLNTVRTRELEDKHREAHRRQSSRAETTSSHVVTVTTSLRLLNQRSVSDFITPSPQAETTTNQDPTTSKPVTGRIHHQKTISDSLLITIVIGALIALPGIFVAILLFLNYCDSENSQERTPVVPEDSKLLSRLLEDEAIEHVCDALDTRRRGRRNYEKVAEHYGFNIYQIEARLERSPRGPSRELIEWLSAYRPEMTIEEFAKVVEETTKRTSVVDLLRGFDNVEETRL